MRRAALAVATLMLAGCSSDPLKTAVFRNPKATIERRTEDLLRRLTQEEKLDLLAGDGWMSTHGIARLGVPPINMADGPTGIRSWAPPNAPTQVKATAFPAGIAMAATWNPELVAQEAKVIAEEAKALGRDQVLGPTINIARLPVGGRTFEGYGEDPWLTSRMAVAYIGAMQGEGVIATVKHFAANNQESRRTTVDAQLDARTLEEIYLPAFRAAVEEAGVWSVMSSYNKLNGAWAAENQELLTEILKKRWGFKGFVVSDWGSTHSTAASLNAGLDLEMPGPATKPIFQKFPGYDLGYFERSKLQTSLKNGEISQQAIDESVRRILRVLFMSGRLDRKPEEAQEKKEIDTPSQRAVARAAAVQSIVLLKNDRNLLPLDSKKVKTIALIGPNAEVARIGGGGSSSVTPEYSWKPADGIRERAYTNFQVKVAQGVTMEGEKETAPATQLLQEAVELASHSDMAIVFVGTNPALEGEFADRKSANLPAGQDELIEAVAKVNKNTVVVLQAGSPVIVDRWVGQVAGVLEAWFGGQETGHAIADVLFGDANPSGKLPLTFPKSVADTPAFKYWKQESDQAPYSEGIFVGYRHYDQKKIEPSFAFGHGLSYTQFTYSDLRVMPASPRYGQTVEVLLKVANTGSRDGAEVVQVYVHDVKSSVERPPKELKAFKRVELKAGETKEVRMTLDRRSMWFYDPVVKDWAAEPGEFEVLVGSSSRDIRLTGKFELFE